MTHSFKASVRGYLAFLLWEANALYLEHMLETAQSPHGCWEPNKMTGNGYGQNILLKYTSSVTQNPTTRPYPIKVIPPPNGTTRF